MVFLYCTMCAGGVGVFVCGVFILYCVCRLYSGVQCNTVYEFDINLSYFI